MPDTPLNFDQPNLHDNFSNSEDQSIIDRVNHLDAPLTSHVVYDHARYIAGGAAYVHPPPPCSQPRLDYKPAPGGSM